MKSLTSQQEQINQQKIVIDQIRENSEKLFDVLLASSTLPSQVQNIAPQTYTEEDKEPETDSTESNIHLAPARALNLKNEKEDLQKMYDDYMGETKPQPITSFLSSPQDSSRRNTQEEVEKADPQEADSEHANVNSPLHDDLPLSSSFLAVLKDEVFAEHKHGTIDDIVESINENLAEELDGMMGETHGDEGDHGISITVNYSGQHDDDEVDNPKDVHGPRMASPTRKTPMALLPPKGSSLSGESTPIGSILSTPIHGTPILSTNLQNQFKALDLPLDGPDSMEIFATVKLLEEVDMNKEELYQLLLLSNQGKLPAKQIMPTIWLKVVDGVKELKEEHKQEMELLELDEEILTERSEKIAELEHAMETLKKHNHHLKLHQKEFLNNQTEIIVENENLAAQVYQLEEELEKKEKEVEKLEKMEQNLEKMAENNGNNGNTENINENNDQSKTERNQNQKIKNNKSESVERTNEKDLQHSLDSLLAEDEAEIRNSIDSNYKTNSRPRPGPGLRNSETNEIYENEYQTAPFVTSPSNAIEDKPVSENSNKPKRKRNKGNKGNKRNQGNQGKDQNDQNPAYDYDYYYDYYDQPPFDLETMQNMLDQYDQYNYDENYLDVFSRFGVNSWDQWQDLVDSDNPPTDVAGLPIELRSAESTDGEHNDFGDFTSRFFVPGESSSPVTPNFINDLEDIAVENVSNDNIISNENAINPPNSNQYHYIKEGDEYDTYDIELIENTPTEPSDLGSNNGEEQIFDNMSLFNIDEFEHGLPNFGILNGRRLTDMESHYGANNYIDDVYDDEHEDSVSGETQAQEQEQNENEEDNEKDNEADSSIESPEEDLERFLRHGTYDANILLQALKSGNYEPLGDEFPLNQSENDESNLKSPVLFGDEDSQIDFSSEVVREIYKEEKGIISKVQNNQNHKAICHF